MEPERATKRKFASDGFEIFNTNPDYPNYQFSPYTAEELEEETLEVEDEEESELTGQTE